MKKLWIYIGISFILAVIFIYTFSANASDYERKVKNDWQEKELSLLNTNPPIIDQRLNIFRPDDQYRVVATVQHINSPKAIHLNTSDGLSRTYQEYCYLTFSLLDQEHQLKVLLPEDNSELFVAFTDLTTGVETYGAGRFLPVEIKNNALNTVIDFNYAYNPYCAYNSKFSCPLPLRENHLNVRIEAGEKVYKNPH